MMEKHGDEGLYEAAEQWMHLADEVLATNTIDDPFQEAKQMIEYSKFMINIIKKFEILCSYKNDYVDPSTFKSASTTCKWVQDGKNPLIRMNIEEISSEPVVKIVHNFISKEGIQELLKRLSKYEYNAAQTVLDAFSKSRIAQIHYIEESKGYVGDLARKLKDR